MSAVYRPLLNSGTFVFLLIAPFLFLSPSLTQGASEWEIADIVFSELEKRIIEDFFHQNSPQTKSKGKSKNKKSKKGLPSGLAKRESLPPGLQKQLQKNGTLPPGLQKRQLPLNLTDQLPIRPEDFERIIVGADVLLIERSTNLIYDILKDAVISQ